MDIPIAAAKHIQLILLGIWPVNLLTLWAQGHAWGREMTPAAVMDLWEWGAFVAFSLAVLAELGGKMFFAQLEHRRKMAKAKEEAREEMRQLLHEEIQQERQQMQEELREERQQMRQETGVMLAVLSAAAKANPELLPTLLQEYQARYQNGAAGE